MIISLKEDTSLTISTSFLEQSLNSIINSKITIECTNKISVHVCSIITGSFRASLFWGQEILVNNVEMLC